MNGSSAQRMRELLTRLGLSQRAAARELGIDDRIMRYWCAGQKTPPRMAFLALERLLIDDVFYARHCPPGLTHE